MRRPVRLVILGTGGTSVDILDTLDDLNRVRGGLRYECVGFLDDDTGRHGRLVHGYPILGPLGLAPALDDCLFVNGIGAPGNFWHKAAIIARTGLRPHRFATIVHPTATISRTARLNPGTVVLQHAVVAANVTIGSHVVVLPTCVVSHDSVLGDHTCLAGGVCVSGRVVVGESCYLGSNCTIMGDVQIGERCLVGMGSVVLRSVPPNSVVVGNPARFLRRTAEGEPVRALSESEAHRSPLFGRHR